MAQWLRHWIHNPGVFRLKPRSTQPFILLRSIKWVPGISENLVIKSKLPQWPWGSWTPSIKMVYKDLFVATKDVKFWESFNFPYTTNFEGLLVDLLNIKLIVHIKTMWFIIFSTKHSICETSLCEPFEQVMLS